MSDYLIKNPTLLNLFPPLIKSADIRISGGSIKEVGKNLKPKNNEEVVDCSGKLIMPGLVNSHTHLYSALARGMSEPKKLPIGFLEILQNKWWKLDEALDEESIYYSALVGSIEAAKYGTTALIDHHSSPNYVFGSLGTLKNAMGEVGLRGILCYETTDRSGIKKRNEGLDENESFIVAHQNNTMFRGMVGAHASFTLSEDSMIKLGELVEKYDIGIHIHVAEDKADISDCLENYRSGVVDRLNKHGLLNSKSIYAHGVHLSREEFKKVSKAKTWLIHNPRSNMNNNVGYAPVNLLGQRSALGTDGFPADMIEEVKYGYFRNQESKNKTSFPRLPELLQSGQTIVSEIFNQKFGNIERGNVADLVILNYNPPTPLFSSNLLSHFIFGITSSNVESVMINGKWVMWNRQFLGVDEEVVMKEASKVAKKLWRRIKI